MKKQAKSTINLINPAKLLLSKWTVAEPKNREKHFLVSRVNKNENEVVISCSLEAVLTKNEYLLNWQDLQDNSRWLMGWR